MKHVLSAFAWGALFGVGLVVSGMTQPGKVIGFLDVAGAWDPSLALVMAGAISVHAVTRRWVLARPKPLLFPSFTPMPAPIVDHWLLIGSALFGLGWGIAGYCPGPAIVASGAGSIDAVAVTFAMVLGIKLADFLVSRGRHTVPDRSSVRPRSVRA